MHIGCTEDNAQMHLFPLPAASDPVNSATESDLNTAPDNDHDNGASSIAAVEAAAIEAAASAAATAAASEQHSSTSEPSTSVSCCGKAPTNFTC